MARSKKRPAWLCKNNHPMWRKDVPGSNWFCYTCNKLFAAKAELNNCVNGHLRLAGTRCSTCSAYSESPWLRELDQKGEMECPAGHPVSHYDRSIMYFGTKRLRGRRCRRCQVESAAKARSAQPDWVNEPMCKNGLHPKTPENFRPLSANPKASPQCIPCWKATRERVMEKEAFARQKKTGLRIGHVDWVVAERLLAEGSSDMYHQLRRGTKYGPTWGEKWVAYCTFAEQYGEPEDMIRTNVHKDRSFQTLEGLVEWRKYGVRRKWKRITISDILQNLTSENYENGTFLVNGF